MKILDTIKRSICLLFVLLCACEPIIEENELTNAFDPNAIKLEVVQATPGGNDITLKMTSKGVNGYWDYGIGTARTNEVRFIYPIPGKSTFTFHSTTAYMPNGDPANSEYVSASIDVQVDVIDARLHDYYYALCSDDLQGKTWKFAGVPNDQTLWWYMCPGDNPGKWQEVWWNAGGDCCPPDDATGKMTFDLAGAANFTYYSGPDASGAVGSFALDPTNGELSIGGDNKILGNTADRGNAEGVYKIIELTAERMVLYVPTNAGGTGWTWIFVPEE